MSDARAFSPRLIGGIVAAGIVAFAAFVLLLAFGGSLASGRDGRGHALSNSAIGFSGLVRLLDSRGDTGFIRRAADLETEDLVVVTLEQRTDPGEIASFLRRRAGRATVLVLPKWGVLPDRARPGWVRWTHAGVPPPRLPGPPVTIELQFQAPGAVRGPGAERRSAWPGTGNSRALGRGILSGISAPVPASPQTAAAKGLEPLLTSADGRTLVGRWGDAPHYLVADPDLLNNHGIADPARAYAAVRLLEEMSPTEAGPIRFDVTLNGFGSAGGHNLLRLLFEPPFLAMTLALLAAAFLAGYHGLNRFGPARPEQRAIAFGKAALVENSAGLIRLAKREPRLGGAYVNVVRQEAARITAAPRGLAGGALDEYLNRFSAPGAADFRTLAERLHSARDRDSLVSAARALGRWKEELIK